MARGLRVDHGFGGYIHLKAIPSSSPELYLEAGKWADRLSANIELPLDADLDRLAPAKSHPDRKSHDRRSGSGILEAGDMKNAQGRAARLLPPGRALK